VRGHSEEGTRWKAMGERGQDSVHRTSASDLCRLGRTDCAHDGAQTRVTERARIRDPHDSILYQPGGQEPAGAPPAGTGAREANPSAARGSAEDTRHTEDPFMNSPTISALYGLTIDGPQHFCEPNLRRCAPSTAVILTCRSCGGASGAHPWRDFPRRYSSRSPNAHGRSREAAGGGSDRNACP
jgi:hypothetical protein